MLKNYLKIAFRNLLKQKVYSFINVFGLAIGLACCVLIFLYVRHELSYDRFHANADRLFRVLQVEKQLSGDVQRSALQPAPLGPALKQDLPGIEGSARFITSSGAIVQSGERIYRETVVYADDGIFEMFSFPLIAGDPAAALGELKSVALAKSLAQKYFGDQEAMGRRLAIKLDDQFEDFLVTAVFQDIPDNSSVRFNLALPIENYPAYENTISRWNSSRAYTYVELSPRASLSEVERAIAKLAETHFGETVRADQQAGFLSPDADAFRLALQPITEIHLQPDVSWGMHSTSDPIYSYILVGIALLVLALACINFTTLAVGRSAARAAEVGLRKVVGAVRGQLVRQFFGEAILLSFLALLLGIGLTELTLPLFNDLAQKDLAIHYAQDWNILLALASLVLFVGLLAGSYPAMYLSKFQPIDVLKNQLRLGGRRPVIRSLVVIQFALSIFLLVSTLVMSRQLEFLQQQNLGYDRDAVLAIQTFTGWNNDGAKLVQRVRNELSGHPEIANVSGAIYSFARGWSQEGWQDDNQTRSAYVYRVDEHYLPTMGMELVAGRNFSAEFPSDASNAVIVNEALVREYGLESPIGKRLNGFRNVDGLVEPTVIGVVENYNFQSLHHEVEPAILHVSPGWPIRYVLIRYRAARPSEVLALVRQTWEEVAPNTPFEYSFLSEDIQGQYQSEARWRQIVAYSAGLAIFIACLGLFGLATLSVTQRVKEIGVRKVLGASAAHIARLIGADFLKLVAIGYVLALPIAWLVMKRWLQDFAYRTAMGAELFVFAGGLAIGVALLTVIVQAMRAALANPVESLRYE